MAAIGVARLDDRDLLVEAGADLVVPTLDDVALTALVEELEERRAVAELRRSGTPSGCRRASGGWSTTASIRPARGCGRRCARSATGTS